MKSFIGVIGIILIIVGIITFAYQGYHYTTREKVAQIGPVEITAETEKVLWFPPMLGGISLVAGIIMLVISRIDLKNKDSKK